MPSSSSNLKILFLTILFDLITFAFLIPVLGPLMMELGGTISMSVNIQTALSLGTLISSHFLGQLSDQKGRKPVLLLSLTLSAIGQLSTLFGALMVQFSFIYLGRFLTGVGLGNLSVAQAAIADLSEKQDRRKRFALMGIAFGLGFTIGPAFGSILSLYIKKNLLFWFSLIACFLSFFNILFVFFFFQETVRSGSKNQDHRTIHPLKVIPIFLKEPKIFKKIYITQFLHVFGFIGIESLLSILLLKEYKLNVSTNFKFFLFLGIMSIIFNGLFSRRSLPLSDWTTTLLGQFTLILSIFIILITAPNLTALFLGLTFLSLSGAFFNPSINSILSKLSNDQEQGLKFGLSQTLSTLGRIFGPVSFGFLYEHQLQLNSLWISIGILTFSIIYWFTNRNMLNLQKELDPPNI